MAALVAFVLSLAFVIGVDVCLTLLIQWAIAAAFSVHIAFWPLFVLFVVAGMLLKRGGS